MSRCLKKGWITAKDLSQKLDKDSNNLTRFLKGLDENYKCYIGRTLVVKELEALKIIPNLSYEILKQYDSSK